MLNLLKYRLSGKTLFFIFILLSSFLYSTIINVPVPYTTIQAGITAATNTDTVLVQPGTYVENINYNGKLITVASLLLTTHDTTYISSTIIDGNSSGKVVIFENSEDSTAVLCGFTITNGLASGSYPTNCGGGIFCESSSPSLENVTISGNSADYYAGGIFCSSSSPSLENVTISGNTTYNIGGGISCHNTSSPSLENVTISGNSANVSGGIYCNNSNPSFKNVTISDNSASNGGGIFCDNNSSPSLENVTISGNSVITHGGGIYCYNSNPSLINSILWNNSPEEIYIFSGSVTVTYSDIQDGTGLSWFGTGCIDSDPLFVDPGTGDYHLSWSNFPIPDSTMSPCIDTGDSASPFDPDSTIADMGAYYFDQTTALDPPQNVTVEIIGTEVHISWDAVLGASSYKVYSSNDSYTGFIEDTSGSFAGESWNASMGDVKKFYYVTAVN